MARRFFIGVVACLLLSGCPILLATDSREVRVAHAPDAALVVNTTNGAVRVVVDRAYTEVLVEAEIGCSAFTSERAAEGVRLTRLGVERGYESALFVDLDFPDSDVALCGADVLVVMPDVDGVEVTTQNGRIELRGVSGDILVETQNGEVEVDGWLAHVEAYTSNGAVRITGVHGSVQAETANGAMFAFLQPDAPGPIELTTSNGSVEAHVGPTFTGNVELQTSNGTVYVSDPAGRCTDVDLEQTSGSLVVERPGASSLLRTTNGDIDFRVYFLGIQR